MFNTNKEWSFIISQTHKEKPNKKNLLRREFLFILQCLLSKSKNKFNIDLYKKAKKFYLKFNKNYL